jgi:hypothetical protein
MPVPQENSFFVERAREPVLDNGARYQNSYYASTKTLLTNSRKPWRNRRQSSTAKEIVTGYQARLIQRAQKTYAVYFR